MRISPLGMVSIGEISAKPGHAVTALFEDRDGDIWFGGRQGIERLRDEMFATYLKAEGLPSEYIGPVYGDTDGRTWFAPSAGGLYWMKDGQVAENVRSSRS